MNKSESELSDQQIKSLFGNEESVKAEELDRHRSKTLIRARANLGQRDTIMFAFIKMWTVLAEVLAPVFASFSAKKPLTKKPTEIKQLNQTKK